MWKSWLSGWEERFRCNQVGWGFHSAPVCCDERNVFVILGAKSHTGEARIYVEVEEARVGILWADASTWWDSETRGRRHGGVQSAGRVRFDRGDGFWCSTNDAVKERAHTFESILVHIRCRA